MPLLGTILFWLRIYSLKIDPRLKKRYVGGFAIFILGVLLIERWVHYTPGGHPSLQNDGEIIGVIAIYLFAWSLVLATRWHALEPWFGGLDQMYLMHRRTAIVGFLLIIPHIALVRSGPSISLSQIGGGPLGVLSFLGLIILMAFALSSRINFLARLLNYERWYILHRATGVFVAIAIIHGVMSDPMLNASVVLRGIYLTVSSIGIVAYLYKELVANFVTREIRYVVRTVDFPNDTTLIVKLEPLGSPLKFTPGQFIFIGFGGRSAWQRHPFSVASAPGEQTLRLSIRTLGDYTRNLHTQLSPGTQAAVSGPHGMFDYSLGGQHQIWIASGIGVAPFLSWLPAFSNGGDGKQDVDFYYTVANPADALFLEEFQAVAEQNPRFHIHMTYSRQDGRLTVEQIAKSHNGEIKNADVFMCGPVAMTEGFERDLRKLGLPRDNIHYEHFNFR